KLAVFAEADAWSERDPVCAVIAARLKEETTAHWVARMEAAKVWHAPVNDYAALVQDPQIKHMEALMTVPGAGNSGEPVTMVNHALRYDGQAAEVAIPPQPLGAQTAEILSEIGIADADIAALAREGAIGLHQAK